MDDLIRRRREELRPQLLRLRGELGHYLAQLDALPKPPILPSELVERERVAMKALAAHLDETLLQVEVGVGAVISGGVTSGPVVTGSAPSSVRLQREADESEIRDVEGETKT